MHLAHDLNISGQEEFEYMECSECGCLQLSSVPEDLSRYYSGDYYAHQNAEFPKWGSFKSWAKRQKYLYRLNGKNPLGFAMSLRAGSPPFFDWLSWAKIEFQSSILDIGCGTGDLLNTLHGYGFEKLRGVDPFIEREFVYTNGIVIWKKELADIDGEFDFIMMNHSFEHVPDPFDVLRHVYRLLKSRARALIRIPIASSYAWHHYGVYWSQLDAPRHTFLHTQKSMSLMAEEVGFTLEHTFFDSYEFGLMISEKYLQASQDPREEPSEPSTEEIMRYRRQAEELNLKGQGDQAGFYLYKP